MSKYLQLKTYNLNRYLLKSKCYTLTKKFENNITEWGKSHENDGKVAYIKKLKNDHIDYSDTSSGLVINQNFSYM